MWPGGLGTSWSGTRYVSHFKYSLDEENISSFKTFCKIIEPLIAVKAKKAQGLHIALTRYTSAIIEPIDTERKLMNAIMGLEALHSLSGDRGEIEFRLTHRAAKILSLFGDDSLEVRKKLLNAYQIRSKVAHGSIIKNGKEMQMVTEADEVSIAKLQDLISQGLPIREQRAREYITGSFTGKMPSLIPFPFKMNP